MYDRLGIQTQTVWLQVSIFYQMELRELSFSEGGLGASEDAGRAEGGAPGGGSQGLWQLMQGVVLVSPACACTDTYESTPTGRTWRKFHSPCLPSLSSPIRNQAPVRVFGRQGQARAGDLQRGKRRPLCDGCVHYLDRSDVFTNIHVSKFVT